MPDLSAAKRHNVFPVSQRGDTLIVVPKGPLGQFSRTEVGVESKRIKSFLRDAEINNLIVDLRHSSYFGTAMLTLVMEFKEELEEGTTALCEVSEDMGVAMSLCKFEDEVPIYTTRAAALKDLCHLPLTDRLLPKGKWVRRFAKVAALCLVVYAGWSMKLHYRVFGSPAVANYEQMQVIWDQIQNSNSHQSIERRARQSSEAVAMVEEIKKQSIAENVPTEQKSIGAAAERLELILKGKQSDRKTQNSFLHHMHAARVRLKRATGIEVDPVVRTTDS